MAERIGVLGGGQLGQMMYLAACPLGLNERMVFMDPAGSKSAVASIARNPDVVVPGDFRNYDEVIDFVTRHRVTTLTIEIEHVNTEALRVLQSQGVKIIPKPEVLDIIKDKLKQKECLSSGGVSLGKFAAIDVNGYKQQVSALGGYPLIIKARREGYDGRGTFFVNTEKELLDICQSQIEIYGESLIDFDYEVSVIVAFSKGASQCYDVFKTYQASNSNMCELVTNGDGLSSELSNRCKSEAERSIRALFNHQEPEGLFAVEMFVKGSQIYVNEIAPRVHNSGHVTQNSHNCSQFEALVRIAFGLDLPKFESVSPHYAMINVVGQETAEEMGRVKNSLLNDSRFKFHWYGKTPNVSGRKMGHINICSRSRGDLVSAVNDCFRIINRSSPLESKSSADVAVIMGSDSDLPHMADCLKILEKFRISFSVHLVSAHRTPEFMYKFATLARDNGFKVIIAAAGGAAHLPGMVAALTHLPVIGVPIKSSAFNGFDSLLSIVQMPRGVPVATVAINNSSNAALLAARILSVGDLETEQMMLNFNADQTESVAAKNCLLEQLDWKDYLELYDHDKSQLDSKAMIARRLQKPLFSGLDEKFMARFKDECGLYQGKVRDCISFKSRDELLLVCTDRLSSFDRAITLIPFKGEVINKLAFFWQKKTAHIIPNQLLDRSAVSVICPVRKLDMFKIEFVVRGHLSGSTGTSIWTNYDRHYNVEKRNEDFMYCGHFIPRGMHKDEKLPNPIVTPTTKDEHDELISKEEIIARGLMTREEFESCEAAAINLFKFGVEWCVQRGLVLADTKYEFGKTHDGQIMLCDEIHTPDCSRFWREKDGVIERFDKEIVREWVKANMKDVYDLAAPVPILPESLRIHIAYKYISLYEIITGEKFVPSDADIFALVESCCRA